LSKNKIVEASRWHFMLKSDKPKSIFFQEIETWMRGWFWEILFW
jgi:hypothetical protein